MARISELMGAAWGSPEGDELDVLATLVDAYETEHFPIDPPDPLMAIKFRMEQQGLNRKDLEPMIGSRARVSEVMTGKRGLTLEMIRRLSAGLGIPADVLIGSAINPVGSSKAFVLNGGRNSGKRKTRVISQEIARARKPAAHPGEDGMTARMPMEIAAKSARAMLVPECGRANARGSTS